MHHLPTKTRPIALIHSDHCTQRQIILEYRQQNYEHYSITAISRKQNFTKQWFMCCI